MKFTPLMGVLLASTLMTASTAAFAEGDRHGERSAHAEARFAEMDANSDGTFTREEALAQAAARFDEADSDNNGTLSEEEMDAMHEARREAREERRAERHANRDEAREERHARHEAHRERREERREGRFERISGDDGAVNLDEFNQGAMHRFERSDLDENGSVTATEMRLAMRARHGGRRHHRDDDGDE